MMWWLLFAAVLAIWAAYWWWSEASSVRAGNVEHLVQQLRVLLRQGHHGAGMTFEYGVTSHSVRFIKYIESNDIYGFKLVIPGFGDHRPHADEVQRILSEESIAHVEEIGPGIHRYVVADFVHDVSAAARVLRRIILEVFDAPPGAALSILASGIDFAADSPITKPDHDVDDWLVSGDEESVASPGTLSDLGAYIGPLMRCGRAHAFLIVTEAQTDHFVQLATTGDGVQLDFPLITEPQKAYEARLRELYAEQGLKPYETKGGGDDAFLDCDISGSDSEVVGTVSLIVSRLFDLTEETPLIYTAYAFRPDASEYRSTS